MLIKFSPVRKDARLTASVSGDVLTVNGEEFDFTPLPVGHSVPRAAIDSPWFAGSVDRALDGTLTVVLKLPHGSSAPETTRFPDPVAVEDGPVPIPAYEEDAQ